MIEAVPTAAVRALPIALEVPCAVVRRDVMLAWDVEDAIGLQTLQHVAGGVELLRLRELGDIACVQHEGRALWQRVHSRYGLLKRRRHILVCFLAEADVTVADLDEEDALSLCVGEERQSTHGRGRRDSGRHSPQRRGAGPRHTTQKASAIQAVTTGRS